MLCGFSDFIPKISFIVTILYNIICDYSHSGQSSDEPNIFLFVKFDNKTY